MPTPTPPSTMTDLRDFFSAAEARIDRWRELSAAGRAWEASVSRGQAVGTAPADAELPKLFFELPRTPYGVRAMDPYEGDNADHYSQGALDGSRAGYFDANVNNLQNRPSHEMEAVLLHEPEAVLDAPRTRHRDARRLARVGTDGEGIEAVGDDDLLDGVIEPRYLPLDGCGVGIARNGRPEALEAIE